ncbi:3607_t:CDS:2 [Ambispora gerdemannii]|uniref:3607_t:CDS:1 n=1 Tax=Ambispora gerdemannii TaxID=144530 RepID=A0A9N9B5Z2_9GLOM|nr:3607_t:CDS:2 [Ambispora gerdemannii]
MLVRLNGRPNNEKNIVTVTNFGDSANKQEYEQCARDRVRREQQLEEEEERKRKGLKPKPADDVLDEDGPRDLLTARTEKVVLDANLDPVGSKH